MSARLLGTPLPLVWGALTLVAGLVRGWATGQARFGAEEAAFFETALSLARGEAWPAYGPPLTGQAALHPGPLFFQLLALPLAVVGSPRAGSLFVAALHVLALLLISDLVRRCLDARAGTLVLLLGAFAPWDVLYADRIWLSCVAPAWAALFLYAAGRASLGGRAIWQAGLAFFGVTLPALHLSAPVAWAAAAVVLVLGPKVRWSARALLLGLGLGASTYLPMLVAEFGSDLGNTRALLAHGGGSAVRVGRVFELFGRCLGYGIISGSAELGYHAERGYWGGFQDHLYYLRPEGWSRWALRHGALEGGAILASVALALAAWGRAAARLLEGVRAARRAGGPLGGEERLFAGLLAGMVVAAILIGGRGKTFYPHYLNLLIPLTLVPVAAAVARGIAAAGRIAALTRGALLCSVLAMLVGTVRYYLEVDRLDGLVDSATVARELMAVAQERPVRLVFTGHDNRRALEVLAAHETGRPLQVAEDATLTITVDNDGEGPLAPGARRIGAIGLSIEDRGGVGR